MITLTRDATPSEVLYDHILETSSEKPAAKRILLYRSATLLLHLDDESKTALESLADTLEKAENATLQLQLKFKRETLLS